MRLFCGRLEKTDMQCSKIWGSCFGQFWLNSSRASVKFHRPLLGQTVSPVSFLSQSKRLLLNRDLIFRFLDFLSKWFGYKLNIPCHHASFHELLSWNDSQQEDMKTGSCAVDINVHERITITNLLFQVHFISLSLFKWILKSIKRSYQNALNLNKSEMFNYMPHQFSVREKS